MDIGHHPSSQQRHSSEALAARRKDGIRNCGCYTDDGSLACTGRRLVLAIHEHGFYLGHVVESWYTVLREMRVQNASIVETN